jgi:predicted Fe-Mo cluster-binding NifX family protein
MKIAIATDGNYVSAHFGRCPSYTIVDIDNGKVINKEVIDNPGHQPGFIPQFLHKKKVECIIAGGMGRRAIDLFNEYGIQTIVGVIGEIDTVINQIIEGTLKGGESLCKPGAGKGYGLDKSQCDHSDKDECEH